MAHPFDICIRGGGIVGRALALHLAALQLKVALCDPHAGAEPQRGADVRAYALNLRSRRLLEAVRCWPDEVDATPVLEMRVFGDDGGKVDFSASGQACAALTWIVDVPVLEQRLTQALRFQPRIETFAVPQAAALTVVCEGKSSSTRDEFGVEFQVQPYAQWALATRVDCEMAHQQVACQWFGDDEILAFLPMGGAAGRRRAVVWSVPAARASELQSVEETAFCGALQEGSHNTLGRISLAGERRVWPLQHAQAGQWCGQNAAGSWVLAGDAAHNVHPLAGQGLNLGLGDVQELAQILTGRPYWRGVDDLRLLRRYERARKADFALIGQTGNALQQLFAQSHPAVRTLRNCGMNGFEQSGPLKRWVARRAMGLHGNP